MSCQFDSGMADSTLASSVVNHYFLILQYNISYCNIEEKVIGD